MWLTRMELLVTSLKKKKQKKQFQDVLPATEIVKLNQVNDSATVNPQTLLPQCEHILQ